MRGEGMERLKNKILDQIAHDISGKRFIKKFSIDVTEIDHFLYNREFNKTFNKLLKERRFSTVDIFECFEPLLEKFVEGEGPEDWLKYIYQVSLSFSFPEAVTIELREEWQAMSEMFLRILRVLSRYQMESIDGTWQSKYPLSLLTDDEEKALEDPTEYKAFKSAFYNEFVYEMMKMNQEIIGYTTLDHICGVHHIAMKVARQLKYAGYPVDLGRVSGAAAGHDIGKFGCKPNEAKKIAYYHYYYTGEWFEKRDIVYIRNVAINHSTWDLELENLSIESLILIYSDFRVKTKREEDKKYMDYFTLKEAFDVILNMLDNVDEAKENRYRRVYANLKDFEDFMMDMGICVDPDQNKGLIKGHVKRRKYFALMQGTEITQNAIFSSINHNINLMHRLRDENSLNKFLETVRNNKNMATLRGYISILEEYHTYLTQKQKLIVIKFLYERLTLKEEDIRKQCAELIGVLLSKYDEEIRKELPPSARRKKMDTTTLTLLDQTINDFLFPEKKIIEKHRSLISYSLRDMLATYFESMENDSRLVESIDIFLKYFKLSKYNEKLKFYILKVVRILPFGNMTDVQLRYLLKNVIKYINSEDQKLKLRAFNSMYEIIPFATLELIDESGLSKMISENPVNTGDPAENYAMLKLAEMLGVEEVVREKYVEICLDDLALTSNIFLSNLKSATLDIAKRFQIELLMRNTILHDYDNCFYTAMHLCNLLKVSALETVRNTAGRSLLQIVTHLSFEQKNDIVVELIRALEMESYEFTKYIPSYLGRVMLHLKPKELDEIIQDFEDKLSTPNDKIVSLIQMTVGVMISNYSSYRRVFRQTPQEHEDRILKLFGVLFVGFVHSSKHVNQTAFKVIGRDIFNSDKLAIKEKFILFKLTIKKILSLMVNTDESVDLIFFNNSSGLKYIYSFISEYRFFHDEINLAPMGKVAFFPGAFDPFSKSHKQIAMQIRDAGYEVFLGVDEFSWSKRTQPNLIRRDIIKKSVASEIDIFPMPRDMSINIANDADLKRLQSFFPQSDVFLVVGSDVIINASAYRKDPKEAVILNIPHIVTERKGAFMNVEDRERMKAVLDQLPEQTELIELPSEYEHISSTLIRNYIDENRDISELVEPLAQNYIYKLGLYQREPQFKSVMTTKSIIMEVVEEPNATLLEEVTTVLSYNFSDAYRKFKELATEKLNFKMLILRSVDDNRSIIGFSAFHWLRASGIHKEFQDENLVNHVREESIGRILVIDGVFKNASTSFKNVEQMVLTETLAYVLARDYSYCVFKENISDSVSKVLNDVLTVQGFKNISSSETNEDVYVVDMTAPCTISLDIESVFKEPYKSKTNVVDAINKSRKKLQIALTELYPGNLLLNFDRMMIYENLIKKICDENDMPTTPLVPKTTGEAMCVPFGSVFKRWILPNTVTKTMHVEKYFSSDLSGHTIKEYPFYLDLENQIKMLKSFNRPIILVDDLLNRGYRIKVLEPLFKKYDVDIRKVIVGIMSGSGKAIMETRNIEVDSAYFIPKIKVWFYESKLYPIIGGDGVFRDSMTIENIIKSVNMILPYSSVSYVKGSKKEAIYHMSEVAMENAIHILEEVEEAYQEEHERLLTMSRLNEVFISPRVPDKGNFMKYSSDVRPSEFLKYELEQLKKLKNFYVSG